MAPRKKSAAPETANEETDTTTAETAVATPSNPGEISTAVREKTVAKLTNGTTREDY